MSKPYKPAKMTFVNWPVRTKNWQQHHMGQGYTLHNIVGWPFAPRLIPCGLTTEHGRLNTPGARLEKSLDYDARKIMEHVLNCGKQRPTAPKVPKIHKPAPPADIDIHVERF